MLILVSLIIISIIYVIIHQEDTVDNFIQSTTNESESRIIRAILPRPYKYQSRKFKIYTQYSKQDITTDTYNILLDFEPHYNNYKDYSVFDLVLTTKLTHSNKDNCIYVPAWSGILSESNKWSISDLFNRNKFTKNKFCAYMYSNANESFNGVISRKNFFNQLNKFKRVDALGKCNNNTRKISYDEKSWIDDAVEVYKPYKFVISFENTTNLDGYVTEKILLPLLAGCIPIYYGDSSIIHHFNPQCFINVHDFKSFQDCIEYILAVDNDDVLFEKYISSPILPNPKYIDWYYRNGEFYNKLFNIFSSFKRTPYIQIHNQYNQYNPKNNIKIINLERSKERWGSIVKQFRIFPFLHYERFEAIEGKYYYESYSNVINSKLDRRLSAGEIGIYLSSCELYNILVNDKTNDYYLVLEDDIVLSDQIKPIEFYTKNAPPNWDIIYLGVNKDYCRLNTTDTYVKLTYDCMPGTFAYIIRKRAAQFFLNFAFPIELPIDELHRLYCNDNINTFAYFPGPITTDYNNISTIENR